MASQTERTLVRILLGVAFSAAIVTAALAPASELPPVALGQAWLYRLEVSLLAFYGCLLLIAPAFSGLIRGRLPAEISTRGAKFTEESAALNEAKIEKLERTTGALAEGLATVTIEFERLQRVTKSDRTQPTVGSKQ